MKFALAPEGLTAAMNAAGHEGYVIPKDKMLNIIAAALPHLKAMEGGEEVIIPQAHTQHFEHAVEEHLQGLWKSLAAHEIFLQSGLGSRLRWLLLGRR